jgi:hypothetical protein
VSQNNQFALKNLTLLKHQYEPKSKNIKKNPLDSKTPKKTIKPKSTKENAHNNLHCDSFQGAFFLSRFKKDFDCSRSVLNGWPLSVGERQPQVIIYCSRVFETKRDIAERGTVFILIVHKGLFGIFVLFGVVESI